MGFFAQSTADHLSDARRALAAAEATIAELEAVRGGKLLEAETITAVQRIDSDLATHRQSALIWRDRIAAFVARQRQEERDRLEAEKAARIADMAARIARWQKAAQQVDEATATLQTAVQNLDAADVAIFGEGPGRNSYLSARSISTLCDREAVPRDVLGLNERRRVVGPLRKIATGAPYGLAEEIAERGRSLIENMQAEPIELAEQPEDETEAAA